MFTVFGFYKFKQINNLNKNKKLLNNLLLKKNIRGTIIISREGVNGSLSGKNKDLNDKEIYHKKIENTKKVLEIYDIENVFPKILEVYKL